MATLNDALGTHSEHEPNILNYSGRMLFHGSPNSHIKRLKPSQDGAFGYGVYLTESPLAASTYAKRNRGDFRPEPTIYNVKLNDARLVDLKEKNTDLVHSFGDYLVKRGEAIENDMYKQTGMRLKEQPSLLEVLNSSRCYGDLAKELIDYLVENGYNGAKFGRTYIIFNPKILEITKKTRI